MASEKKNPLVFSKTKSAKIVVALSCMLILVVLVVPLSLRYALQSYLVKHGATDATISSLSLNPFTGTVKVKGVRVNGSEKRLFASNDFNIDVSLLSLFQKEIVIETAYYDNLTIDIEQAKDGRWRIASYMTPALGMVVEEQVVAKEVDVPSEWDIKANQVLMTNCVVDLVLPDFSTQLVVEKAELTNFSTKADDAPALFSFIGSVDGSPLTIALETFDLIPDLVLVGTIDFQKYELSRLQKILAPYVQSIGGSLSFKGTTQISLGEISQFSYTGDISLAKAALVSGDLNISAQSVTLKGETQAEIKDAIKLTSSASLRNTGLAVKIGTVDYGHKGFSWIGDTSYGFKSNKTIFNGKLNLQGVAYSDTAFTTELNTLAWSGKGKYVTMKDHLAGGVDIGADVVLEDLFLSIPGQTPLDMHMEKAEFTQLVTSKETIALGSMETTKTSLYSPLLKKDFLEFSNLLLTDLITGKDWSTTLRSTSIKGINIFPRKDSQGHTASMAQLDIDHVQWSKESGPWLKKISSDGLNLHVVRDKRGSLNLGEQIAGLSRPQSSDVKEETSSQKQSQETGIRIDRIEIGGKNIVFYKDYTLEVPFESESEITSVVLENLDSKKPEQDSTLLVNMLFEKRAPLKIEGIFHPFVKEDASAEFLKLKYSLKNYPIRNLSPYAVQNVGTALHSGELRLIGDFVLDKGVVDSNNDLMLKRLTTKAMSAELAAKVDDKLPIPLDAALALLRDNDDNISLSLPIDGPVDELNFDVSDAVIIALGKAVVPAASSYLVYALGPYGALAYVGMKVGENILEVRLPPVKFEPKKAEFTAESKDYLKRVGAILNDGKAQSDMQVCPVVSLSYELGDLAPQKEETLNIEDKKELEELGQERANIVREHLINEYGVDGDRLLLCITTFEKKGDSEVLLYAD